MKKNITLFICLAWCAIQSASAWNRTAHEAIAYIAEQHLTPSAKAAIENMAEELVKLTADEDNEPLSASKRPELDGMNAIMRSLDRLENRDMHPKDSIALDIKFIVHLIGDIHCPAHIVYPKTTRFFPVKLYGRVQKYHR